MTLQEKIAYIRAAGWDVEQMTETSWKIEEPSTEENWDPTFIYDNERGLDVACAIISSRRAV